MISWPNSWTEPLSGVSSPVIRLNSVVLPAPFGPMISRRSPGSTLRLTLLVTCRPPNDLQRPVMVSALIGFASAPPEIRGGCRLTLSPAIRHSRTVPGTSLPASG